MGNFLKNYSEIANDSNKLVQKYFDLTKQVTDKLDEDSSMIDSSNKCKKKTLKNFLGAIQNFYDKLSELQYRIQRFDDIEGKNTANYKDDDGKDSVIYIRAVNESLKGWLSMLQFRYLTPVTIKLSEFDVKSSFNRDFWIFALSIIVSAILGFVISWHFDKDNDCDLKKIQKQTILNQDTIKTKIDGQNDLIKQNTILLDSLISIKNGTNNR